MSLAAPPLSLRTYLFGTIEFDSLLRCQRHLHYEICGDRTQAALILCEHPPLITVGRHGSRAHILPEPAELGTLGWGVRWVNRGGGCWLHQPGQLAVYALLPLDRLGLTVASYQRRLGDVVQAWLGEFDVESGWRDGGAWVGTRLLAGIGVGVRNWVSYFGLCLNIHPVLDPYRLVRCSPQVPLPMTSLERERRTRVSPTLARERLITQFQKSFGFERLALFTEHTSISASSERSAPPRLASKR